MACLVRRCRKLRRHTHSQTNQLQPFQAVEIAIPSCFSLSRWPNQVCRTNSHAIVKKHTSTANDWQPEGGGNTEYVADHNNVNLANQLQAQRQHYYHPHQPPLSATLTHTPHPESSKPCRLLQPAVSNCSLSLLDCKWRPQTASVKDNHMQCTSVAAQAWP